MCVADFRLSLPVPCSQGHLVCGPVSKRLSPAMDKLMEDKGQLDLVAIVTRSLGSTASGRHPLNVAVCHTGEQWFEMVGKNRSSG